MPQTIYSTYKTLTLTLTLTRSLTLTITPEGQKGGRAGEALGSVFPEGQKGHRVIGYHSALSEGLVVIYLSYLTKKRGAREVGTKTPEPL